MPITINNYNFSNAVYEIMEGGNIPGEVGVATITISPNSGHTVTAADFSLDPSFSNEYVSSVAFTQSGDDVICSITFVSTSLMPAQNVTIPLCVVGEGVVAEITIAGTLTAKVGNFVTGDSSETNTPYSNDGVEGDNELMFSRTYNAASGYYWSSLPSINIVAGNQSNYNIVQTPTFDSNDRLTNITYAVNYIYPSANFSGDHIAIDVPSAQEIYNPLPRISGYTFNTSALGNDAEIRSLVILGTPSTTFSATLNDGTTTTTIINNQPLDANGRFEQNVSFPALTKGSPNVTYTITLTGSNVPSSINGPNPFTISQLNEILIRFRDTNPPTPIAGWPAVDPRSQFKALSQTPYSDLNDSAGSWVIDLDYDVTPFTGGSGHQLTLLKQIELSDFSNTESIELVANGNQTNTTTLVVDSTTGVVAGQKIAINSNLAPYSATVSSVDSSTQLTVTPAITVSDNQVLGAHSDNGNKIQIVSSDCAQVDTTTVKLKAKIAIANFGDDDVDFDLNLSNIISYTP